jgi:hypothetical protein
MVGFRALGAFEPRQVRKEAALRTPSQVTRVGPTGAGDASTSPRGRFEDGARDRALSDTAVEAPDGHWSSRERYVVDSLNEQEHDHEARGQREAEAYRLQCKRHRQMLLARMLRHVGILICAVADSCRHRPTFASA